MNKHQPALIFCIMMDILGYATYAIPGLGELGDIIWAPISAIIFFKTFGGWKGAFGGIFNFVEEIIPGTDFIPTFTIAWLWMYFSKKPNRATEVYEAQTPQPPFKKNDTFAAIYKTR